MVNIAFRLFFTSLLVISILQQRSVAIAQYTDVTDEKLTLSVEVDYLPGEMSLELSQNTFVRTRKDGFMPKSSGDTAMRIGTSYLTWHAKGLYEILIYTDNMEALAPYFLNTFRWVIPIPLYEDTENKNDRVNQKISHVEAFVGIYPISWVMGDFLPYGGSPTILVPIKVWVSKTAGRMADGSPQLTAPVEPDGTIKNIYFKPVKVSDQVINEQNLSFYVIPERRSIDPVISKDPSVPKNKEYGTYKKVIASTVDGSDSDNYEITIGMDLYTGTAAEPTTVQKNWNKGYTKYVGKVYIDMIGN